MNPIAKEPVLIQALAAIVVWAATRYGLHIDDEQALKIAGGAFVVLAPFVRQLVTPAAKLEYQVVPGELVELHADPTTTEGYRPADQFHAPLKGNVEVRDPTSTPPPSNLRGSSL
jgi:hypothetical protein